MPRTRILLEAFIWHLSKELGMYVYVWSCVDLRRKKICAQTYFFSIHLKPNTFFFITSLIHVHDHFYNSALDLLITKILNEQGFPTNRLTERETSQWEKSEAVNGP